MADRTTSTEDTASGAQVAKKPYTAPVLLQWGNFQDVTQTNNHSSATDSRSGGRSYRGTA